MKVGVLQFELRCLSQDVRPSVVATASCYDSVFTRLDILKKVVLRCCLVLVEAKRYCSLNTVAAVSLSYIVEGDDGIDLISHTFSCSL